MISFSCSGCAKAFSVKDEFAGRTTKCPTCGTPLVVPAVTLIAADAMSSTPEKMSVPGAKIAGSEINHLQALCRPIPVAQIAPSASLCQSAANADDIQTKESIPKKAKVIKKFGKAVLAMSGRLFRAIWSFITSLHNSGAKYQLLEGYWCDTAIKLPKPIPTPMGSKVKVLTVCVDIWFTVEGENVLLHRVRLATTGSLLKPGVSINVASQRSGEGWAASVRLPDELLMNAVSTDIGVKNSRLRTQLLNSWRARFPEKVSQLVTKEEARPVSISVKLPDLIAVIDVETTGLSPWHQDRIIEIAIVVMSPDGEIQKEYETLVNPLRDIGPTHIHGITASDVIGAPTFDRIAGDVLDVLKEANVVAGHNASFDRNFVVKEFERLETSLPELRWLCTCNMLGRQSLSTCCEELGVELDGKAHRALTDARAVGKLLRCLWLEDPRVLDEYRFRHAAWPRLPRHGTACLTRERLRDSRQNNEFLQRLGKKGHYDVDEVQPNALAYLALLDRVLEDRIIDKGEEELLIKAAESWQLSANAKSAAHRQYVKNLAVRAVADGIVTATERRDLHIVCKLLGVDDRELDTVLEKIQAQLNAVASLRQKCQSRSDVGGKRVCFTGQLQATMAGEPISRELAEALAEGAGCIIANSVTKKLDILVVADPHTQSGKAKKARQYGIQILADNVFWRMAGVQVG